MRPQEEIDGIAQGQAALDRTLAKLDSDDLARPSLLPDWTVAHVLAHVARNADSVVRRLQAAIDDQVVEQYVGGAEGRAREIAESSKQSFDELVAHVRQSSADVERLCDAMPDDAWERISITSSGDERTARYVVYSRWREVEIHHVDLGLDYSPTDWPDALVQRMVPEVLQTLPGRADNKRLLAWMIGRTAAPGLESWG